MPIRPALTVLARLLAGVLATPLVALAAADENCWQRPAPPHRR